MCYREHAYLCHELAHMEVQTDAFAGEINIFDIEDPTGKQMKYARFFGRIAKTSDSQLTYTGLLVYIAKAVFDIAPTDFTTNLGTVYLRRPRRFQNNRHSQRPQDYRSHYQRCAGHQPGGLRPDPQAHRYHRMGIEDGSGQFLVVGELLAP